MPDLLAADLSHFWPADSASANTGTHTHTHSHTHTHTYTHARAHALMHAHTPHGEEELSVCAVEKYASVEWSLEKNTSDVAEQEAARVEEGGLEVIQH